MDDLNCRKMPLSIKIIHSQQGATLIISLIMLLLFMLISISAVKSASFEERMASNSQRDIEIYHAAYSEVQAQSVSLKQDNTAFVKALGSADKKHQLAEILTSDNATQTNELEYLSTGTPPPQFSLSKDYAGYRYKLSTQAEITNVGAKSTQVTGLLLVAPKS